MATTRLKLDGTAAGLLQLLQSKISNMAVLMTDGNTYSSPPMSDPNNDVNSYDKIFQNITTNGFYVPPTATIMTAARGAGFNLGQVFGGNTSVITDLENRGIAIVDDWFDRMIEEADVGMAAFLEAMKITAPGSTTKVMAERVSQLYRPGFSRVMQPTLTSIPFDELINQNLLLPPSESGAPLSTGGTPVQRVPNTTNDDMSSTYENLWSSNRAIGTSTTPRELTDSNRFKRGTIAGTGINDIQEPLENIDGTVSVGDSTDAFSDLVDKTSVPFTFKDDDAKYLTYKQRRAGFTQNLYTTRATPEGMAPAVSDIPGVSPADGAGDSVFKREGFQAVTLGDGQYFPFTFSTVNKQNNITQLCTLQATIQSLGESYSPTWQSKHFFGRSEQVHTYTFTDRVVDISFVVHADEMRKLQNVYERVLWLAQQCYPDYSNDDRLSAGPIIAMRVGDLFQHKAGFIRSLSYDWSFLGPGGKWELTKGIRMPQGCNVTMSYQIIHENTPSRNSNFYGGPGGGLAAGVSNFRSIDYANPDYDDTSVRTNYPLDFSNEGRYIPHPGGGFDGEQSYLDNVDIAGADARLAELLKGNNAEAVAEIPSADAYDDTGGRSLIYK